MSTTPKDDGGAASCALCGKPASHYQGHQHLCPMHYRFGQMRANAKRRGKAVPSHTDLGEMTTFQGGACADCRCRMNWLARDGQATVATLQHYRDGPLALVCRSCNTRHAAMPGDSYRSLKPNHKYCPRCKRVRPFTAFAKDRGRSGPMKMKSWCRDCSGNSHTQWRTKNRDRYNAAQRAYRAKRKAEGRPVAGGN